MRRVNGILTEIKNAVWGAPTLVLLIIFGIYFTFKSGFYRPKALKNTVKTIFRSLRSEGSDGISPLAAISTALGGTVGVGSIIGVGYGIAVGGAGSIFWMWVCSFFGMGLKYAEIKIALGSRRCGEAHHGGAPFRLKELGYKRLAAVFSLLCVLASFGTGNLTQVGSISRFLSEINLSKPVCALICVAIIAIAVFGGRNRIANINKFIVPFASTVYLSACLIILILNLDGVPYSFEEIFGNAFGFSAVAGGFSGAMLSRVIREGFARSLFSNEAGMGSSPLAHATSSENDPTVQAQWGIFEIFFDTFVVSTITALCLLSVKTTDVASVFVSTFGVLGKWGFLLLTAVFAFASVISWCYYSECCISFAFPKNEIWKRLYRIVFSFAAFLAVYLSDSAVWEISDILNALMTFPNLFLLFKCRKEIERL